MAGSGWLRRSFFAFVALLFGFALLGMFVTGPVVVSPPRFDLHVEPSPGRLRSTVEQLCFGFGPRSHDHPENLERAAIWIGHALGDAGFDVEFQTYDVAGRTFRNVVGRRAGSDPAAGAIVIGAHYDAVPGSPGANDNASGVAVLLELARTLPDVPTRRTHYLVAFSTEEPPCFGTPSMGSFAFARRLVEQDVDVGLMVALDLVGYYTDQPWSQHFPSPILRLLYPGRGNFVAVVGDARSGPSIERVKRGLLSAGRLRVQSFRAPASTSLVHLSDHWAFRQHGMPAVQLTDTAFLRYPYYHHADDTPERLDYERMAELVRALHGILWEG